MKKIVFIMVTVLIFSFALSVNAGITVVSEYQPSVKIEYGYSAAVECGTVRYMSQMVKDSYFYDDYWGAWKSRAGYHCSTCSISMALSYIGINKTPLDILNYGNGSVYFGRNWGGAIVSNYTYDKLSEAVDRFCNGNGKYSPVIIHLDKYTSAGHFVIIIGRVSENVYQVLDPSISEMWNITINGSTATYKYPFGERMITDTIDRSGRTDDIYQWYNADAKLPGYLGECTTYTSYCSVKVTSDIALRSLPCEASVNSESQEKETITTDTVCTAVALIKNSIGEYWYKIDGADGSASYIRADKTEYISTANDDVIIFGATSPVSHIKGKPYPIKGTIASTYTDITSVEAWVSDSASTIITGGEVAVDGKSYVLNNSTLDYKVIFNDLDLGANTYSIYATYLSYYVDGSNNIASYSERVLLYEATFNVYLNPANCTHSYEETVIKTPNCQNAGLAEYFCGLCASSYTEELPATGIHEYGDLVTVKEPTCSEKGEAYCECSICGYEETVEIDTLSHLYTEAVTPPTCTEQGYTTYTCTCGDSYVDDYVDATGHSYESTVTPPTELEQGYTTHICKSCGDSYTDTYTDPIRLKGDLNNDGAINVDDVLICLDLAFVAPTEEQLKTADLDGNGEINVDDVLICLDFCFV